MPVFKPVLEAVERAYMLSLQAHFATELDEVEAYWTALGATISLPDVPADNWNRGNIPDELINGFVRSWPYVILEAILAVPSGTVAKSSQVELLVQCWTRGETPQQANDLNHRYAQTIAGIIHKYPVQPTDAPIYTVQEVTIGVGETLARADGAFTKRCAIRAPLLMAVRL